MKFIDSNVLAYAFYKNDFQESSQRILERGGLINTLNLIETFNTLEKITDRETATVFVRGLLKSNLTIVDVDINIFFEALKRTEKYRNSSLMDLIHYVTALLTGCESIVSNDKDFDAFELKRETT